MSINNPFSGKDWSADQMVADYSPKEVVGIDNNGLIELLCGF